MANILVVVDGMALFDWKETSIDIYMPYFERMHEPLVCSGAIWTPVKKDKYVAQHFHAGAQNQRPDPMKHFALSGQVVLDQTDLSHYLCVAGLPYPKTMLGGHRYSVDATKILNSTKPYILQTQAPVVIFCEQTVLLYDAIAESPVLVGTGGTQIPPMRTTRQHYEFAFLSRPLMDMDHSSMINNLLRFEGTHPHLALSKLTDTINCGSDDTSGAGVEIPARPRKEIKLRTVDGTGCGSAHRGP